MRKSALLGTLLAVGLLLGGVLGSAGAEGKHPKRLPRDLARDASSKPHLVIPLLDLVPGDRVVDLFAGGGYYSELLAAEVGEGGTVLLHNNRGFRAWGINLLNDRFAARALPNVREHIREIGDLDLGETQLDAALIVMALHDLYVVPKRYDGEAYVPVGEPADARHVLAEVYEALKPGGRFVVVDHRADPTVPPEVAFDLHRMHEDFARQEVMTQGFEFIASYDYLENPSDDRTRIVFDSDLQGRTDRFVLVFAKP